MRTRATTWVGTPHRGVRADVAAKRPCQRGSVLVIVLWIAFGLVSLALYFSHSMNFELRASDNRVSAMAADQARAGRLTADQAIEGAVRYLTYLMQAQATGGSNGIFITLDPTLSEAVPVGEARYWLIGRDTNNPVGPGRLCFGLVDEASKLNLKYKISFRPPLRMTQSCFPSFCRTGPILLTPRQGSA